MRKSALISLLIIFGCLAGAGLSAQTPYFKLHPLPEDLQDVVIQEMFQSEDGYMWLGTTHGLLRYDGLDFRHFHRPDTTTSNTVTAIFQDRSGTMWIGYQDGQVWLLQPGSSLLPWTVEEGWPDVPISGFAQDAKGYIWIATYGEGMYCWTGTRLYNFDRNDGLLANDVYTVVTDLKGEIWIGTDGGVNNCSFRQPDIKTIRQLTREDGLPDDIVRDLLPDEEGHLYIGTYEEGICRLHLGSGRIEHLTPGWSFGIVNSLAAFKGRELWIGTENQGALRMSLPNGQARVIPESGNNLLRSKVYKLLKDQEGNIWMSTNSHGLCSANRQFEFIHCHLNQVQSILKDQAGRLWAGTQEGLFVIRADSSGIYSFQRQLAGAVTNVVSLFQDKFGYIWIGTFGQGILCYDPRTGRKKAPDGGRWIVQWKHTVDGWCKRTHLAGYSWRGDRDRCRPPYF